MKVIANPTYSRPVDVHRWSDHPEVKALVETIWENYLPEVITGTSGKKRTGPRPKTSFKEQLRVLILDLYVAWLEDPELSIGVPMSLNAWNASSRYNGLHLSRNLVPIIRALADRGLLDMANWSFTAPGAKTNRTTRIRASEILQGMFQEAKFDRDDVFRTEKEEVIILRDDKGTGRKGKEVEYEDTDETIAMRAELMAYNDLLASSFIDIPVLEDPVIPVDPEDPASFVHIHPDNSRVHRVFSRKDWRKNGRFYGGWWQRINDEWRSKIFIDDQPTVEVDFSGLHVAILYAEAGAELQGDPYILSPELFPSFPPDVLRRHCQRKPA